MARTPRRKIRLVIAVAVATIVIVTAWVLLTVAIPQVPSGYTMVGNQLYSFESENVFGSPWSNFTYRGVTFEFHVYCSISPGGGELCGNVSESTQSTFPFSIWEAPTGPGPGPWLTWVAPDSHVAIQFASNSNGVVHLLVAA